MSRDRWLLVSIAANALLAAGWLASFAYSSAGRPAPATSAPPRIDPPRLAGSASLAPATIAGESDGAAEWPRWIRSLRAAGVSARLLATLVTADFDHRWENRQRELQHRFERGEIDAATLTHAQGDHDQEQDREVRAALGEADFHAWKKDLVLRDLTFAGVALSPAESDQIYAWRASVEAQRRALEAAHRRGEIDDASLADRAAAVAADGQAKINALLGDARLAVLNLADDGVEVSLRQTTAQLNLPAKEFDELADLQRARVALQNDLDRANASDPSSSARHLAVDAARDEAYERILGPERFDEWRKSADRRYQVMQHYASALYLSDADIANVYASLQQQEKQARDYQLQALAATERGAPANWAAVQDQIDESKRQTEAALRQSLGEERFEKLQRNHVIVFAPGE